MPGVIAAATESARRAAVRGGEQLATSPNLGRVVKAASRPAARGAGGGVPGYLAAEALTTPAVLSGAEAGLRGTAAAVARTASGPVARFAGPIAIFLSMLTESGDRPIGETPERTAERQQRFQQEYDAIVKVQRGGR